jgi:hypothetical protein
MNHRLVTIGSTLLCVLGLSLSLKAEKPNILVAQHGNVLVNATNNYQVNPSGDLVAYTFATNLGGALTVVEYTITKKSGKTILGQIPAEYFPVNADSVEFVGLERNIALLLFTTSDGSRVYMTFTLVATNANPRPSKTNVIQHVALDNERCTLSGSRILSLRYADDTFEVLRSIRVYNHSWTATASKGIDDNYGALAALNAPIYKYYVGVTPDGDPERVTVSILRP